MLSRQLSSLQARRLYSLRVGNTCPQGRWASTSANSKVYDIVCIGGGPAGLSLLTALRSIEATSTLKLALIESRDLAAPSAWSPPPEQYSNRASSLTPSSKAFLESIGAWGQLSESRVQPYYGMQVWDGVSGSRIEFDGQQSQSGPYDRAIAYITENDNLVKGLLSRLAQLGGADIFQNTKVEDIALGPQPDQSADSVDLSSWPHVALSNGEKLAARLLVGADGLNSPVRSFAGIGTGGWDYNRHGLVATLRMAETPEASIAYQRFLPTGPVAFLPLPGPFASLVWSTTPKNAQLLKSLSPQDFVSMVNAAFRLSPPDLDYLHTLQSGQADEVSWRMSSVPRLSEGMQVPHRVLEVQDGSVASFPLRYRHADTYATHRVALVGDAAHTTHPLAGQGLNMGIGDVESLVGIIQNAMSHGQDIGDQLTLEAYNAERYEPNHRLLGVVDKLHKLYSFGSGPVVGLRSLGLEAVNAMAPVKDFLMAQASGRGT